MNVMNRTIDSLIFVANDTQRLNARQKKKNKTVISIWKEQEEKTPSTNTMPGNVTLRRRETKFSVSSH